MGVCTYACECVYVCKYLCGICAFVCERMCVCVCVVFEGEYVCACVVCVHVFM